jgi:hypothetical protein
MRTDVAGHMSRMFPPAMVAGVASFVLPLMAVGWKVLSPGYHCPIRGGLASAWNSPCIPVAFFVAYGLGWIIDRVASRVADGVPQGDSALERIDRIRRIGMWSAVFVGMIVGVPSAANVINPCP